MTPKTPEELVEAIADETAKLDAAFGMKAPRAIRITAARQCLRVLSAIGLRIPDLIALLDGGVVVQNRPKEINTACRMLGFFMTMEGAEAVFLTPDFTMKGKLTRNDDSLKGRAVDKFIVDEHDMIAAAQQKEPGHDG